MKNYRMLAIRYLKMNMRRSRITVFGVVVTTILLFLILNLSVSALLAMRTSIREEKDYEMVLFTETEEQIAEIIADTRIRTAYVGPYTYAYYSFNEQKWVTTTYDRALYINLHNPYRLSAVLDSLRNTYGVEGELNSPLAATYLQIEGTDGIFVFGLLILFVSFIFAIFGVGIVRNSIQLCILESIRDYGNLRCIGAAKGQLRAIIYMQGAGLELTGITIGIVIGTIISMIVGVFLHIAAGFHILPAVFILIVFLGDLYFAMQENCKLVVNMTPVSAIRGEYRIQKEKIKLRKNKLIQKLLGVDGDYAYKSIMRNSKRFTRTVGSLVFGIGALLAVVSFTSSVNHIITRKLDNYGYYQLYFQGTYSPANTISEVQSFLPPTEVMERLAACEEITEGKRMYTSRMLVTELDTIYNHYSAEMLAPDVAMDYSLLYDFYTEDENVVSHLIDAAGVSCYGYDAADYQRYQSVLMDGTLDVSENGIVILNRADTCVVDAETGTESMRNIPITNYQIGDTIDIVDMGELHNRIGKEQEALQAEEQEALQAIYEQEWESMDDRENAEYKVKTEYLYTVKGLVYQCWEELIAEGKYRTYTIEGMVSKDVNHYYDEYGGDGLRIILPLERYFALTDTDESMSTGMQYHFNRYPKNRSLASLVEYEGREWEPGVMFTQSILPWELDELVNMKKPMYFALLFAVFIMMMSALNIINSTASNLHLRRKEFAQLRVIGVSKKRLMRMVMLEGIITTVVANVIGILVGVGIGYYLFWLLALVVSGTFYLPIGTILICVLASILLLCGSIYVSLKDMKQNMAEDLKTGGD